MNILQAKVSTSISTYDPHRLQILVDKMAENLRYKRRSTASGQTFYCAEEDGYVSFFLHEPRDETGYGGHTFHLTLEDGTEVDVKGPWSSRPSIVGPIFGLEIVDCSMTPDPVVFERGHTFFGGDITLELAQEAMKMLPGWLLAKSDTFPGNPSLDGSEASWHLTHQGCDRVERVDVSCWNQRHTGSTKP